MKDGDGLHILLVDDETIIHQTIGDFLRDDGHDVTDAYDGTQAVDLVKEHGYDLAIVDLKMPRMDGMALLGTFGELCPVMPVAVITGHGTMDTVVEALRLGAADFLTKPIKLIELDAVIQKCLQVKALRSSNEHLKETIRGLQVLERQRSGGGRFVGCSAATEKTRLEIQRAVDAQCDTILIYGETGTGKEVVAQEIHALATEDKGEPFVAVSCPALPDSLVESELFGHMKGTFTGATQNRAGYFELADGGTLFLDEVADLSPSAQATLLRVLETRKLRRVGASEEISVNVRVVTATNVRLEELAESGRMRRDLFYRLNVFSIELLPLRERREDILPLAEHFLTAYTQPRGRNIDGFSEEACGLLRNYDFPGNARELRNLVERAAIMCGEGQIEPEHINLTSPDAPAPIAAPPATPKEAERDRIVQALEATKWNRRQAAEALNMPYSTLRYKLKNYGIG